MKEGYRVLVENKRCVAAITAWPNSVGVRLNIVRAGMAPRTLLFTPAEAAEMVWAIEQAVAAHRAHFLENQARRCGMTTEQASLVLAEAGVAI